jgi:hypothetical protein
MQVPFRIIVERQEFDLYAAVIDPGRILVLDPAYQRDYDTCDAHGGNKTRGSGPARNFAWDHAKAAGAKWHWTVDDNIRAFYRLAHNLKIPLADGSCFRLMEEFAERYQNVGMVGPNYVFFAKRRQLIPPFTINTRIYSCNLIRTDLPFRWRARFNEDTDLSLRMLKASWCTVLFNAFLQAKQTTLTMRGGNTDELYRGGTVPKSRMIVALHPDVTRITQRFGRVHHYVDYRAFAHIKPVLRDGLVIPSNADEHGLRLIAA